MLPENSVRKQEYLCSWRKRSLQACSKTKPMFTNLLSEKVREFNGVIRNPKDRTEKCLWEIGKRLNFNESISSIVFRMVLFASGLFFVWRWEEIFREFGRRLEKKIHIFTGFGTSRELSTAVNDF